MTPATQEWCNDHLKMLDQRLLPHTVKYNEYTTAEEVAEAITTMVVRGAPAIGHAAAFGMALEALHLETSENWPAALSTARELLAASRPTAVNLFWALERCDQIIANASDVPSALVYFATRLYEQDILDNQKMGAYGASLLAENSVIYTHCNAGALATAGYGTALGVIRAAHSEGKVKQVFAGETRPWMQGARLTAWELMQEKIPVTLTVEGAAAHNIKTAGVDWIIVGSDRIAANGDVANKIGTLNLAIIARHLGAKFMVAAPTNTIDMQCADGTHIDIEQRATTEVTHWKEEKIAPSQCPATNPAFDVTPYNLVDAIVTEKGIITQPNKEKIAAHMAAD